MTTGTGGERLLVRLLVAVLAGALCGLAVVCAALWFGGDDAPAVPPAASPPATADPAEPAPGAVARDVLRRWDAARATAWRRGDVAALAALYTPGSVAGERDVAMLRAWNRRGRQVTAMTTQVLDLRVLADSSDRMVLQVTDRVARLEAGSTVLPRDGASTHRLGLRRDGDDTWRVAWVLSRPAPS